MSDTTATRVSRREFFAASALGLVASGAVGAGLGGCATGAMPGGGPGQRVLLRGGVVLTMDPNLGDFEKADVLIEGSKIAKIGTNLQAAASEVDASNMIVMPGFVDSHRHIWQGQLRNILPNGRLYPDYASTISGFAWRTWTKPWPS